MTHTVHCEYDTGSSVFDYFVGLNAEEDGLRVTLLPLRLFVDIMRTKLLSTQVLYVSALFKSDLIHNDSHIHTQGKLCIHALRPRSFKTDDSQIDVNSLADSLFHMITGSVTMPMEQNHSQRAVSVFSNGSCLK